LSKMLQFSHSTRIISHKWKIESKRRRVFMHSLVDSTLNTSFDFSSNYNMVTKKKNQEWSQKNLQHWNYFLKWRERTLYFSLWCIKPSKFGVGLSYEIRIQHTCEGFSQYDNFINRLQSLWFKFFDILIIFTKSNSHTMIILNVLNLSKTSRAMLGSPTNS
jgi:hypothetical protein